MKIVKTFFAQMAVGLIALISMLSAMAQEITFDAGPQELVFEVVASRKDNSNFFAFDSKERTRVRLYSNSYAWGYIVFAKSGLALVNHDPGGGMLDLERYLGAASQACPVKIQLEPATFKIKNVSQSCKGNSFHKEPNY